MLNIEKNIFLQPPLSPVEKGRKIVVSIIVMLIIFLVSCVEQPVGNPQNTVDSVGLKGVFVLCEGLWGMDNASLSVYNFDNGKLTNDYFGIQNNGLRLGDLANDIVVASDTVLIAVSGTKTIESFRLSTGKSLGRIILEGRSCPRKICVINDSIGFFTDLYDNSIIEFNYKKMELTGNRIIVGPAPEGICSASNNIFVANSGYGDYMADKPLAGTVSVIELKSKTVIKSLINLPNVIDVFYNRQFNRLYAVYNNLPSLKDSLGGIVEFNGTTFGEIRRWRLYAKSLCASESGDTLFFLNNIGIGILEINSQNSEVRQLIINNNPNEKWYALSYRTIDKTLWVGNALNYQVEGELLIFDLNSKSSPFIKLKVGINPNRIVFY